MKYPRTNEAYEKSWRDDADRVNTLVAERAAAFLRTIGKWEITEL